MPPKKKAPKGQPPSKKPTQAVAKANNLLPTIQPTNPLVVTPPPIITSSPHVVIVPLVQSGQHAASPALPEPAPKSQTEENKNLLWAFAVLVVAILALVVVSVAAIVRPNNVTGGAEKGEIQFKMERWEQPQFRGNESRGSKATRR